MGAINEEHYKRIDLARGAERMDLRRNISELFKLTMERAEVAKEIARLHVEPPNVLYEMLEEYNTRIRQLLYV